MADVVIKYGRRPIRANRPTYYAFEAEPDVWRCPAWPGQLATRHTLERWAREADVTLVFIGHQPAKA